MGTIVNGLAGDLRPGMRVMRMGHFRTVTDVAADVLEREGRYWFTRAITLDTGEVWHAYDFTCVQYVNH